ncbi:hypothetical protein HOC80_00035 [archaeon]|jgi:hypothetical protein|nr:hypothetical protein [archaeon]MBT4416472.1 hypothetical protein [archaeon]
MEEQEPLIKEQTEWGWTPGKVVSTVVFGTCLVDLVLAANTGFASVHEYYGFNIPGPDTVYAGALLALSGTYVSFGRNPKK